MIGSITQMLKFCILAHLLSSALALPVQRIAILGDSITYDGRWVTKVESALRDLPKFRDAQIVNFGLASETISGLSEDNHAGGKFPRPNLLDRLDRIIERYQPTMVIACYGMNDGIYLPLDDARMKSFQDGANQLQEKVSATGADLTFITAPLFKPDDINQEKNTYDQVLDAQAKWLTAQAREKKWLAIDIRPHLRQSISITKKQDPTFIYASDGIHPGDQGHTMMATAVTEGLWEINNWPGKPRFAETAALAALASSADLLKHAWLSAVGHKRPGVPTGKPLSDANTEAALLLKHFHALHSTRLGRWNQWEKIDFTFDSRPALLVRPNKPAPDLAWIWRTEFFGHQPQADLALLAQGYHLAYIDMQNMYGSPAAIALMASFHDFLVKHHNLAPRVIVEGFSRGGLYALNWATTHPDKTAAIYVDAPVCDIKSWPGGKGKGLGSKSDWARLLAIYQLTEEQALAFTNNPIDRCDVIAKARIPIIAVVGQADEIVPVEENIDIIEKMIRQNNGFIEVIRKPNGKHHPHSLEDPKPIVDFLISHRRF